ncbi:hypothetical protein ACQWF6_25770, partial [Salmonella enterica subsp. enterica serovar Infantis]
GGAEKNNKKGHNKKNPPQKIRTTHTQNNKNREDTPTDHGDRKKKKIQKQLLRKHFLMQNGIKIIKKAGE